MAASMPPLPRPTTTTGLLSWASALVSALEIQMRRLTASQFAGSWDTSATAAGTTSATAYPIKAQVTIFTTVAAGTGAILPPQTPGTWGLVFNAGAHALMLYGAGTINGGTSISVAAGSKAIWMLNTSLQAFAS